MTAPPPQDPVLRTFGKYHIVRPLKLGGTAAIYLAVMRGEDNFSREVVVKRPLPHLVADPRSRKMFLDEAHIASRLNHPNICQVLDLVARQDEIYLVLEYLRGVDLREILKQCIRANRLIPPEVAVWIAIEVCAGLEFAHNSVNLDGTKLELVHRDVSPKNIRITYAGSVKVIDFGIAWATGRQTETAAGTIKGTLGYMSPEQILGDEIDRRSDVFAFGICLFQTLTNRNPFDGPTLKERVRRLTQAPVPSVRDYNPALDEEIEAIVARCLDRDITRRYPRMRDVQVDLERYLARLQVVSPARRLVQFLEDIFPSMHESDPGLVTALSELSRTTGVIDTSQRLVFPDDPPTDQGFQPQATLPDSTSATQGQPTSATMQEGTRATAHASGPPRQDPHTEAGATRPMMDSSAAGTDATRVQASAQSGPAAPSRGPWPWIVGGAALALALVLAFAAGTNTEQILVTAVKETPAANDAGAAASKDPAPDASATGLAAVQPPPSVKPPPTVKPPPVVKPPPRRPKTPKAVRPAADPQKARLVFRTARRFDKVGRSEDAEFMYQLAFAMGSRRANPSIFLNLGLMYNAQQDVPKAKACLRAYLERSPDAANAPRVRTLISSFPSSKTVACVSSAQARGARSRYARNGAKVDGWLQQTLEGMLR